MSQSNREFILKDDLKTVMWRLSWPAIVAMVLYGLNNFLDGVFVGQLLGNTALAAVGIAFPLSQIAIGLGSMIGMGAGSILSIWLGAQEYEKLSRLTSSVNFLSLVVSVISAVPCYLFAEEIIGLMGGKGEVATLAVEYYKVTLLGTFFWVHGLSLNMMIRAEGKMKVAALLMGIGLLVDIILKPLFISTFGWGVAGAAWATNVSMLIYSLQGLIYYRSRYASFRSQWFSFKFHTEAVQKVLSLGAAVLVVFVMTVVQSIVVFNALAKYGKDADIAFYAATNRYFVFLLTPIYGLMRALQPVAGMNYGAKNYQRTLDSFKLFWIAGTVCILPFFALAVLFPEYILHLMMPLEGFTSSQIWDFRIYLSLTPLIPVIFLAMSYFPAVGNGKSSGVLSILRQVVFILPAMILLPRFFGVSSIYWGTFVVDTLVVGITVLLLRNEFKRIQKEMIATHQGS